MAHGSYRPKGARGGIVIASTKLLEELKQSLGEYFFYAAKMADDSVNVEAYKGVPGAQMPEALALYYSVERSGLPLSAGGYFDQPYLLSQVMDVCASMANEDQLVRDADAQFPGPG